MGGGSKPYKTVSETSSDGAREATQCFGELAALLEDTNSIPCIYKVSGSQVSVTPIPGDPMTWLLWAPACWWYTDTHASTHANKFTNIS